MSDNRPTDEELLEAMRRHPSFVSKNDEQCVDEDYKLEEELEEMFLAVISYYKDGNK